MVFAIAPHAGRGNGDAFVHEIEIRFGGEFALTDFTPGFQRLDVRLTVGHHFLVQTEFAMLHGLVPLVKVLSQIRFHPIGVVIASLRPRPHVPLMCLRVEEMQKETFLAFRP